MTTEQQTAVTHAEIDALVKKALSIATIGTPAEIAVQIATNAVQTALSHRLASQADQGESYRHIKRGTTYTVLGLAELQMAQDSLVDGSSVVVYRGDDGRLWVREEGEFHDGRFEKIATHPQPSQKGEGDE